MRKFIKKLGNAAGLVALLFGALPTYAVLPAVAHAETISSRTATEPTAPDATTITKIVAGSGFNCLLTAQGVVYCWGSLVGDGGYIKPNTPQWVSALGNTVKDISAGNGHACAVMQAGNVKCWGNGTYGQLGNGQDGFSASSRVPTDTLGLTNVISVTAGGQHTCALKNDGSAWCWGSNAQGALGISNTTSMSVPVPVNNMGAGVVSLAAGFSHTCAVRNDGSAWCWGNNFEGQIGDNTNTKRLIPTPVSGLGSGVASIYAYVQSCALLTTGGLKCWGFNEHGEAGDGTNINRKVPVDVTGLSSGVTEVSLGWNGCARTGGTVKCWGRNETGQIGDGTTTERNIPTSVTGLSNATSIAAGKSLYENHACAVVGGTSPKCWGTNYWGELGIGEDNFKSTPQAVVGLNNATALGVGQYHTCAIVNPGTVKCWGRNDFGSPLGLDGGAYSLVPITVRLNGTTILDSPVNKLATSSSTNCAYRANAGVCWGSSPPPVTLFTVTSPSLIAIGSSSCVILNGAAKCSGSNTYGQLGDGTNTDNKNGWSDVIGLSTGVTKIVAGGCALVGGGVRCWGYNAFGQLGDGTKTDRNTPVAVSGLSSGVADISIGSNHACAALNDGTVKCWGSNFDGQLGDGTTGVGSSTPVLVAGLSGVTQVRAGDHFTCALTSAGAVLCWGSNFNGNLGIGSGASTIKTPTPVVGLSSGVTDLVLGGHACALMQDTTVRCWGNDFWGQLGDQSTGFRTTPVDVLLNAVGSTGGTLNSPDSNTTFTFASGTFTLPIGISYTVPSNTPALGSLKGVNRIFDVTPYFIRDGQPAQPSQPYSVLVRYSEADLNGAPESSLALYYWDGSKWVLEPSSSVDAAANTVSASPNHFSTWAVLSGAQASNKKYVYLPMIVK